MGQGQRELHAPEVETWANSGVAGLTGRADGPPLAPASETVAAIAALVADAPVPDPLALLGERAALGGLGRQGATSCGGAARLVPTTDGWLAVNLARPDDVESVAAWLELPAAPPDPWVAVAEGARTRLGPSLVERAGVLGLPVAVVGATPRPAEPVVRHRRGSTRSPLAAPPLVVDLSALWAGPLCSHLLLLEGARVIKVESRSRPDGGRRDETGFFDLLNHGKEAVALDLPSAEGVASLMALLGVADVVIEGSRPRALRQWGIDAEALLAEDDGPRVWLSITGYGRDGAGSDRVGFGDDTAAAGGLVIDDGQGPCFFADAVADPLAGIAGASAIRRALAEGGTWLLDVALARVAASVVHADASAEPLADPVAPPRSRTAVGPARPLGADTAAVLAALP